LATPPFDFLMMNLLNAGKKLHVGAPNIGSREVLFSRINDILDRRWLSNNGVYLLEFERKISNILGVRNVVAMCNATVALEIAARALELHGEVIIPSYTFIATAHSLYWQGITPVFADIDPKTHNINVEEVERLITPKTTGIVGVHIWGRGCDTEGLGILAKKYNLKEMYDASHGFACSKNGQMLGSSGQCEVFSFHATKFINSFEGGAVVTNDDELAEKMRLMRNFGFKGFDNVVHCGVNGKMSEVCAAMGLTNLEQIEEIITINRRNYLAYQKGLSGIKGISLIEYDPKEQNNFQYIIIEVDSEKYGLDRNKLVERLHEQNIIARKYFWPGCHLMEPYRSLHINSPYNLPETDRVAARVVVLPTGQTVDEETVDYICQIIKNCP